MAQHGTFFETSKINDHNIFNAWYLLGDKDVGMEQSTKTRV